MKFNLFMKIAIAITVVCSITIIIFNALTTPLLVTPKVEIIEPESTYTQEQLDQTPEIKWSDGKTTSNSEYTPPSPVDPNMWWDINEVTKDQLCQIPGVGDKTAQKILDYRETLTKYYDISELTEIDGIGDKKLETLKQYLYVKY